MCKKCDSKEKYKRQSYCYSCWKKDALEKQAKIRQRNRWFIFRYLNLFGKCVDCGETDWKVLEFDHRDRETKKGAVSKLYSNHYSLKTIKKEIKKCDIRCANCHKIKTRKQLGWFDFSH